MDCRSFVNQVAMNRLRFHCDSYALVQVRRKLVTVVVADRRHLCVLMEVQPNQQVGHRIGRSNKNKEEKCLNIDWEHDALN